MTCSSTSCRCPTRVRACRTWVSARPACRRMAFSRLRGLAGSARYEPAPMSSAMGGDVGGDDRCPGSQRLDDRQGEPLVEGRDHDEARLRQQGSHLLVADAPHRDGLARPHRGGDGPVVDARLLAGHPDDDDLARRRVAGGGGPDARQHAERVLARLVAGHDDDRPGATSRRRNRPRGQHIARPRHDRLQGVRTLGRATEEGRQLRAGQVRDADELVVEAQGVQCCGVLGPRRHVPQVDRRVVHRDEVEYDSDRVRGAVQQPHQRIGARGHGRGLHEHAEGGQRALSDACHLLARAGQVRGQLLETAIDQQYQPIIT